MPGALTRPSAAPAAAAVAASENFDGGEGLINVTTRGLPNLSKRGLKLAVEDVLFVHYRVRTKCG